MNVIITYLEIIILLPLIAGIFLFFLPERFRKIKGIAAVTVALVTLFYATRLFFTGSGAGQINLFELGFLNWLGISNLSGSVGTYAMLNLDNLGRFIMLLVCFVCLVC